VTNTIADNDDGGVKTQSLSSNPAKITVTIYLPDIAAIEAYLAVAPGGGTAEVPILLTVILDLADSGGNGWADLLGAINTAGKYVELNLSYCTMSGTEFDPDNSVSTGKSKIVSLILPDTATSIKAGADYDNPTFKNFTNLKSVSSGAVTIGYRAFQNCTALKTLDLPAVQAIGEYAFSGCTSLETVSLPKATIIGTMAFSYCTSLKTISPPIAATIGNSAFLGCTGLSSVSLPAATRIDGYAFMSTGTGALTVTLGAVPPELETELFHAVTAKSVIVKVPAGALGSYGSSPTNTTNDNWGNAFRGGGWDGESYLTGKVNSNITLTIEAETP
jgi:hypothetical protein